MFNLIWGTIIGFVVGVSGKILMEKEEGGSVATMTIVGVGGSLITGCIVGFWDPSSGIIMSYFGAFLSLGIYSLVKNRRKL